MAKASVNSIGMTWRWPNKSILDRNNAHVWTSIDRQSSSWTETQRQQKSPTEIKSSQRTKTLKRQMITGSNERKKNLSIGSCLFQRNGKWSYLINFTDWTMLEFASLGTLANKNELIDRLRREIGVWVRLLNHALTCRHQHLKAK